MLSTQPFYAIIISLLYIGIVYLLVRKEKRSIFYGLTVLASLMQLIFLYLWLDKIVFLMIHDNLGPKPFKDLYSLVDTAYFLLFVPFFFFLAWYGIKAIARRSRSFLFKWLFIFIYIATLLGLTILGNFIFIILFYGFTP